VSERVREADADGLHELSARELVVTRLLSQDMSDREIAERLGISVRTVNHHVANVKRKLGVRSRHQVAALAFRHEHDVRNSYSG
jgi:DNA-binding CsgD family transcriptional regulator